MANIDRAFVVDDGISIDDFVGIFYSDTDPSVGGFEAPAGSILLDTTGKLWIKYDALDTDWQSPVVIPDAHTVLVSPTDTTAEFLGSKLSAGSGIGFNTLNVGGNEVIQIATTGGASDELVKISANDTTGDYLGTKLVAGSGIVLTETNDGANETLVVDSIFSSADLGTATVGITTSTAIPLTFADVLWDQTYTENNTAIVEHDTVQTERILIKETGLYILAFSISFDADALEEQIDIRILRNGSIVVPGSLRIASEDDEINDLSNCITAELVAGDYLTLQAQANGTGNLLHNSSNWMVMRATGATGPAGSTGAVGDLSTITLGLIAPVAINTTFTDLLWGVEHVQNNIAILEHDSTNTERILIKESGLYFINFSMSFDADALEEIITARILQNGSIVVPGSLRIASEDDEINDLSNAFTAELVAGDYITFQSMASGTGNVVHESTNMSITRAVGVQGEIGPIGPAGSGTTLNILDEGSLVTGGPHSSLNFVGTEVAVTDAGAGQADITIASIPPPAKEHFFAHNGATVQTLTATYVTAIIGTDVRSDAIYSNTNGEVTINKTGNFKVHYEVTCDSTGSRSTSQAILQVNGVDVPGTNSFGYHRNTSSGENTSSATALISVTTGDIVRVRIKEVTGTIVTVAEANRLTISEID